MLTVVLNHIGTYSSGVFDGGGAEIVAYDKQSQRLLVTNTNDGTIDVLDISHISMGTQSAPTLAFRIDTTPFGLEPTSVAVHNGVIAVSARNELGGPKGEVALFAADGTLIKALEAGYGPDMITFTPDGNRLLVANQGRPTEDYLTDQQGSVSIIDLTHGPADATIADVGFQAYDGLEDELRSKGIRIFGPVMKAEQNPETGELEVRPAGRTELQRQRLE